MGGLLGSALDRRIREDMTRKFPGVQFAEVAPSPDAQAIAFAYFRPDLRYLMDLFRHDGISFRGKKKVVAFGLWSGNNNGRSLDQEHWHRVLDFVSEDDFVVQLRPEEPAVKWTPWIKGDRILVARVAPGKTLFDTVSAVMKRRSIHTDESYGELKAEDDLVIPCVNFDLTRSYHELVGHKFLHHEGGVARAWQEIVFKLDEEGMARAWSIPAHDANPRNTGRKMICDAPFLILLAHKEAKLPHFALWVENDELLVPSE
ncbi:MAG TPA: hypothetical protein VKU80_12050 [Planctomycetota bacterium]|nr:hypothetical protein [Planctomycetota bacterium]